MDITIRCPNCFQEISKEDSFCIYCGCDLDPSSATHDITGSTAALSKEEKERTIDDIEGMDYSEGSIRTCKNGHKIDDPYLDYCPECGLPLERAFTAENKRWTCYCGVQNGIRLDVCRACGKPRGWEPDSVSSEVLPVGMRLPRPEDLRKKK